MKKKIMIDDAIGFIEILEVFGSDLTVVNAARVSFHKESEFEIHTDYAGNEQEILSLRDEKLIDFLARHDHITPFFHAMVRLRIKMPIFIAREWFRHTIGFARNEVSRRYVVDDPEFYVPQALRQRRKNVIQGSSHYPIDNNQAVVDAMHEYNQQALSYYKYLLDNESVCPEQARMILPQSMYTEFIETASIAAYARLVGLRIQPGAQKEIRDYAHIIHQLLKQAFPVAWKSLIKKHDVLEHKEVDDQIIQNCSVN